MCQSKIKRKSDNEKEVSKLTSERFQSDKNEKILSFSQQIGQLLGKWWVLTVGKQTKS